MKKLKPFPVVGIGASAGGLEALGALLEAVPADTGMAFVIVQHLDPSHESLLTVILQRKTKMPVAQATNGTRVAPNRVYVIPPASLMCLKNGQLVLKPRLEGHAFSVDCFLESLAEDRGDATVAVILSGTASDGARGVKAVKAAGGIVFSQDEKSAAHAGMPHSAAATGAVDAVLSPQKIGVELARLARHPFLRADEGAITSDPKGLDEVFAILRRVTGVDFSIYKPSTIRRRMLRRLLVHKLERLEQYVAMLKKDPAEARALHDDMLIHVTQFFREPKTLEAVRGKVFPRLLKGLPPGAPIRVWVPGCSSGEEPYTLAVLLLDFLSERDASNPVQIFATDISEAALEKARAGIYAEDIEERVPQKLLRRFFKKTERGYEISKSVRDLCVFAKHDITRDPPFSNLDLISCCNVLIYLGPLAQKQVLPMFHYALRPAGSLVVGNAETVGEFEDLFALGDKRGRVYFKKLTPNRIHFAPSSPPSYDARRHPKETAARVAETSEVDLQRVAERILLSRYAPAGVIVNADMSILHFRGRINRFLEPATGKASLTLLRMMPTQAAAAVKELVKAAGRSDEPVRQAGLELGEDGAGSVSIEVLPFRLPTSGERFYIVLFEEDADHEPSLGHKAVRKPSGGRSELRRLRNELASTRGYLQTIVEEHEAANEELKSANEEILSSNEELQSTNEELEIAKEELQAANEELSTLNEELQTRNGDLGAVNNDLNNLLASVHLPIVMVGVDLRIKRYTPMAERIMNLIPTDIGRPIGDIRPKLELPNIEEIIHDVIESVTTKELEVLDFTGRRYLLRVRPYKTNDNKIEGAVVIFMENEPIRRGIGEDASAFEAILDMVTDPIIVLDGELRVQTGSSTMYQSFGLTKSHAGRSLFETEGGRWNIPALRVPLERLAKDGKPFSHLSAKIGDAPVYLSGRRIASGTDGRPLILLSIERW